MMKLKVLAVALVLPLSAQGDVAVLQNNKLFLEVWNGNADESGQSYIKDLGITMDDFLKSPGCYTGVVANLSDDANLAGLKSGGSLPATAVWTVQAVNNDGLDSFQNAAGSNPQDPNNHSGFLATVVDPAEIQDPANYPTYIDPVSAMKGHITSTDITGSKAFGANDLGYYLEPGWDAFMNQTVGFTSSTKVSDGGAMEMYFFTVDADFVTGMVGRNGRSLGSWSFDGNQVSFTAATQPTSPCPTPTTPSGPTTPTEPTTPSGPTTPTEPTTPSGPTTPTEPTTPSGPTTPTLGKNLQILFPKAGDRLKVGIRQPIGWLSGDIDSKQRLNLYYSKNGGAKWKLLKRGLRVNGYYLWKPRKNQVSENGVLAICLPSSKTALADCSATDGMFSIHK